MGPFVLNAGEVLDAAIGRWSCYRLHPMATAQPAAPQTTRPLSYNGLILPIGMILLAILLYSTMNTAVLGSDFNPTHFLELAGILFLAGMMSVSPGSRSPPSARSLCLS